MDMDETSNENVLLSDNGTAVVERFKIHCFFVFLRLSKELGENIVRETIIQLASRIIHTLSSLVPSLLSHIIIIFISLHSYHLLLYIHKYIHAYIICLQQDVFWIIIIIMLPFCFISASHELCPSLCHPHTPLHLPPAWCGHDGVWKGALGTGRYLKRHI